MAEKKKTSKKAAGTSRAVSKLAKSTKKYYVSKACGKTAKVAGSVLFSRWFKPLVELGRSSHDDENGIDGVPLLYRCKKCKRYAPSKVFLCGPEKI